MITFYLARDGCIAEESVGLEGCNEYTLIERWRWDKYHCYLFPDAQKYLPSFSTLSKYGFFLHHKY